MTRNRKRLGFLPGWRIFTYVIIAINLLMLTWLIASVTSIRRHDGCGVLEKLTCADGTSAGPEVAALLVISIWALMILILGALWLNTGDDKTRPCRECGHEAVFGTLRCGHCAAAFRRRFHGHSAYLDRRAPR
jgi:hypothetical protein